MPTQDDIRENKLIDLFNLERPPVQTRHGVDAILNLDGNSYEFELKSVTTTGGAMTTVRDFGRDHIEKWKSKHWIVGVYKGDVLTSCLYGSPEAMAPWINDRWEYIRPDLELAQIAPRHLELEDMYAIIGEKSEYTLADARKLHKNQYSTAQYREAMQGQDYISPNRMLNIFQDRLRYVIERGSTLNNPKVSKDYLSKWPEVKSDHAATLRELVRGWKANQTESTLAIDAATA